MGLFDKQFGNKKKNIFDQISELLTGATAKCFWELKRLGKIYNN